LHRLAPPPPGLTAAGTRLCRHCSPALVPPPSHSRVAATALPQPRTAPAPRAQACEPEAPPTRCSPPAAAAWNGELRCYRRVTPCAAAAAG